tara:strand:+ start:1126 stop:1392 length:267 start_codon:yes stop_codon:yes gene_type:complete
MSLFTNAEAKACTMVRCDFMENAWIIGVSDNNSKYYEVRLDELSSSASKSEIQNATITALATRIKQTPISDVISKNEEDDIGIGNSLG